MSSRPPRPHRRRRRRCSSRRPHPRRPRRSPPAAGERGRGASQRGSLRSQMMIERHDCCGKRVGQRKGTCWALPARALESRRTDASRDLAGLSQHTQARLATELAETKQCSARATLAETREQQTGRERARKGTTDLDSLALALSLAGLGRRDLIGGREVLGRKSGGVSEGETERARDETRQSLPSTGSDRASELGGQAGRRT